MGNSATTHQTSLPSDVASSIATALLTSPFSINNCTDDVRDSLMYFLRAADPVVQEGLRERYMRECNVIRKLYSDINEAKETPYWGDFTEGNWGWAYNPNWLLKETWMESRNGYLHLSYSPTDQIYRMLRIYYSHLGRKYISALYKTKDFKTGEVAAFYIKEADHHALPLENIDSALEMCTHSTCTWIPDHPLQKDIPGYSNSKILEEILVNAEQSTALRGIVAMCIMHGYTTGNEYGIFRSPILRANTHYVGNFEVRLDIQ